MLNGHVQVDEWAGPGRVKFSYKLAGDRVAGGGTCTASAIGALETGITLQVCVVDSWPMAPMWEAMGKPLSPQFAAACASCAMRLRRRGVRGNGRYRGKTPYGADG